MGLELLDNVDLRSTINRVMSAIVEEYGESDFTLHLTKLYVSNLDCILAIDKEYSRLSALLLTVLTTIKPTDIESNGFIKKLVVNMLDHVEGYKDTDNKYNELLEYIISLNKIVSNDTEDTTASIDAIEDSNLKLHRMAMTPAPRPGVIFKDVFDSVARDSLNVPIDSIDYNIFVSVADKLANITYEDIINMYGKHVSLYYKSMTVLAIEVLKHMKPKSVINILKWLAEDNENSSDIILDLMSPVTFSTLAYNGINYVPDVQVLQVTPLTVCDAACAKSRDTESYYDNGIINYKRMDNIINKYQHESVAEHVVYTFDVNNVSRALLQELVRHRMGSFTVKSTRYTLKELKEANTFEESFYESEEALLEEASKYILLKGIDVIDKMNIETLDKVRGLKVLNYSNDKVKYVIPEAYLTSLVWTVNLRSLRNFLKLRTDKSALEEIRMLAHTIYTSLPFDHLFMVVDKVVDPK